MKKIWILAAAIASSLTLNTSATQITLDENGNLTGFTGYLHMQLADTGNGSTGFGDTTLTYLVPSTDAVSNGWVVVYDPGGTVVSDIIHFDNSYNVGGTFYQRWFFYSSDQGTDLADHFPSPANVATIVSGGAGPVAFVTEHVDGNAFYTPGTPGAGQSFTYEFLSTVPDSGTTAMLLGIGVTGISVLRRKLRVM